ncbi:MAG: hypothetical protein N3G18_01130 [Candidatus Saccharicenans sp.]|nr:hypothetical protein [Candidatus Saccharicenans sp.]
MPEGGGREKTGRLRCPVGPCLLILVIIVGLTGAACRSRPVRLLPPNEIRNLGGQASFYLNGPDGVFRFRLGFFCLFPATARLEFIDPLGRLRAILWLGPELATLYLPTERIYWQGESRVLTSEVFGQELKPEELARILAGLWSQLAAEDGWQLQLDGQGHVLGGERNGLLFVLKEKFPPGQVPKKVHFSSPGYTVRMHVLKLNFNRGQEASMVNPVLPPGLRKVDWEEMAGRWKR